MGQKGAGLGIGGADSGAAEPDRDVDGDDLESVEQRRHVGDEFHTIDGRADPTPGAPVEPDDRLFRQFCLFPQRMHLPTVA